MTNNTLAAQCLIEAASLLGESAGRNGLGERFNRERSKHLQDKINKAQKIYDQYKRSGHADKYPGPDIEMLKSDKNYEDNMASNDYNDRHISKSQYGNGNTRYARDAKVAASANRMFSIVSSKPTKNKALHDRINSRAKAKNEAAAECYLRAAQLLDESYDVYDDYDLY